MEKLNFLGIAALVAVIGFVMIGCGDPGGAPHTHNFGMVWKKDATQHWHECSCGEKTDIADHTWKWVVTESATLTEDGEETETCSICDETKGEPRPVLSLKNILEAASGGDSADDPVSVALKLDLGDMPDAGSNWIGLLAMLDGAGKYVALDLSDCTLTGTSFNTGVGSSSKPDGMDNIVSIVLPDSVTSIDHAAFINCYSLTSVVIPDSITSIGNNAFFRCSSLTSVIIPDGVTSIGIGMFYYCTSLESVTIPDSVTTIDTNAFYGCTSLESVIIPDGVTTIGNSAFNDCTGLTSVTIGGNVTLSNGNLFDSAYNDTCGKAPGTYTRENGSSEEWTWKGGNGAGFIVAFHSMGGTYINAHTGLQSGASVNAPAAPTKEGYTFDQWYTDSDCTEAAIFPFTVSADVMLYAGLAYNETPLYTWLTGQTGGNSANDPITIPKEQIETDLGSMTAADSNWNKLLLSLSVADKFVSLDLSDCTLTGTTFNTGVGSSSKPDGMDNIVSIVLPDSVESIGFYAFCNCTSLASVTIPDSVTSISFQAFYGCSSLASVDIPDSVTSIGMQAFYGCRNLVAVTCLAEEPPTLGMSVFGNTDSSLAIKVPADSVEAYKAAENWSDYAERIVEIE